MIDDDDPVVGIWDVPLRNVLMALGKTKTMDLTPSQFIQQEHRKLPRLSKVDNKSPELPPRIENCMLFLKRMRKHKSKLQKNRKNIHHLGRLAYFGVPSPPMSSSTNTNTAVPSVAPHHVSFFKYQVNFPRAASRIMGKKGPRHLILTSANLTDKPYEVQLDILRSIRTLLHEVVDEAAAVALQHSHVHQPQLHQQEGEGTLLARDEGAHQNQENEDCQDKVDSGADEGAVEPEISQQEMAQVPAVGTVETSKNGDISCRGNGRKRPRTSQTSPRETEALTVGSVVECFHPVSSILR